LSYRLGKEDPMVQISFEGTSRAAKVDPLNMIPAHKPSPSEVEDSFDSHLQGLENSKTAPAPANEERRDDPADDRDDPSSPMSETPQTDSQNDSQEAASPADGEHPESEPESGETSEGGTASDKQKGETEKATLVSESALQVVEQTPEQTAEPTSEPDVEGAPVKTEGETPQELPAGTQPEQKQTTADDGGPADEGAETENEATRGVSPRASRRETSEGEPLPVALEDGAMRRSDDAERSSPKAAAVVTDTPKTTKRPAGSDPSPQKTAAPNPVDASTVHAVPESPALDAESDSDGHHERTAARYGGPNTAGDPEPSASSPTRFAQHLVARGGERPADNIQLNNADQMRFVDRVARAFRAAEGRQGVVRLRLSPPELGSLRLEIKVQGGALAARLEADTSMARSLLMENLPVLRERLAEQGIRIEQFDVELLDRREGGQFGGLQQREQRSDDEAQQSGPPAASPEATDEVPTNEPLAKGPGGTEQLDVVI